MIDQRVPRVRVRLYGKPGCHLCEDAEADLARLRRKYPHSFELVDITQDARLLHEYGSRIPVLVIDGHEYDAPLDASDVERALAQASRAPADNRKTDGAHAT